MVLSAFFYCYSGFEGTVLFAISIAVNLLLSIVLNRAVIYRKALLFIAVGINIGLLFYCKYFHFFVTNLNKILDRDFELYHIIFPLGISFFTFQQISYVIDTYRGETKQNSVLDYLMYILYFPKLLMGPIVGQDDLIPQFHDETRRNLNFDNLVKGIKMFALGLFKKVLIADTFAAAVSWGFDDPTITTSFDFLIIMFAYTFQIYFDFSGYSDMAIGVSCMLNIDLPVNFDSPYKALSISDFWKRWHISLTKFLTKYIYIPLGGSRKGKPKTCINTLVVFTVSGFWHGASWGFVLWGTLHGILMLFDKATNKKRHYIPRFIQWVLTFLAVSVLWLLFRSESISQWIMLLKHIFSFEKLGISKELISSFIQPEVSMLIGLPIFTIFGSQIKSIYVVALFTITLMICCFATNNYRREYKNNAYTVIITVFLLVSCITCLSSESIFVYNNF